MDYKLLKEKLKNMDCHYIHPSFELERKLINEIKLAMKEEAFSTLDTINSLERAVLSRDPLRSLKNSLIASCTLFTRAVIEAGVSSEDAFSQSDLFIMSIESIHHHGLLLKFEYEMVEEFISLVIHSNIYNYPKPISRVVRYIYEHITEPLSLSLLAEYASMSSDYLSKLFILEVGMPVTPFIQIQKIEIAKYFLRYSQISLSEIATLLSFCNPGYFTKVFIKHTGLTPSSFRKLE
ncbi:MULTISPECIES: helix-turn-helix domain-containing protein [unclassified Fusibacter]|uniref:helix-turn-helix domain-containing protein n=1 Tax=unclassified Fusibacter TaxID=2624464 RepID=UPI0013E90678|nr:MULTISPECIES: AraC family transcriptional regulator [unclassified Fusibacter]MCK8060467.1 AraC family transcriptional regulator [Fusibacter sp. A2]NPE20244.1 helix-turn-helix domain-containing protein [Fusibacter sp. A1]